MHDPEEEVPTQIGSVLRHLPVEDPDGKPRLSTAASLMERVGELDRDGEFHPGARTRAALLAHPGTWAGLVLAAVLVTWVIQGCLTGFFPVSLPVLDPVRHGLRGRAVDLLMGLVLGAVPLLLLPTLAMLRTRRLLEEELEQPDESPRPLPWMLLGGLLLAAVHGLMWAAVHYGLEELLSRHALTDEVVMQEPLSVYASGLVAVLASWTWIHVLACWVVLRRGLGCSLRVGFTRALANGMPSPGP